MSVSRRAFVRRLTSAAVPVSAGFISARGREAWVGESWALAEQAPRAEAVRQAVRLNSNENPLGPGPSAVAAIEKAFAYSGRYPMNARPAMADLRALIARKNDLKPENVTLGAGSGEILEAVAQAFTSRTRAVVAALPTFEQPGRRARQLGASVIDVPVDTAGRLDCEKMIAASDGAGLVFVCNPNNPTATVHSAKTIADLVARISKASPDTTILIDEAYHDYVTDPSYATAIPMVTQYPNLIISRTMSKAHGMAGLRLGYAVGHADAIGKLAGWMMPYNANALAVGAGFASIEDEPQIKRERERNQEARQFALEFFRSAGFSSSDSQANFLWVDLRRPAREFREACAHQGILVGRDFPPLEKTHCRISIGTMEEMRRAVGVFRSALGVGTPTAGGRPRR